MGDQTAMRCEFRVYRQDPGDPVEWLGRDGTVTVVGREVTILTPQREKAIVFLSFAEARICQDRVHGRMIESCLAPVPVERPILASAVEIVALRAERDAARAACREAEQARDIARDARDRAVVLLNAARDERDLFEEERDEARASHVALTQERDEARRAGAHQTLVLRIERDDLRKAPRRTTRSRGSCA